MELIAVDGKGGWFRGELEVADKNGAEVRILQRACDIGEPSYRLHMGMGILKNASRFENFVEKAVELGVTSITPVTSRYAEAKSVRDDRLNRIMIAALKQCGRSRLPVLNRTQSVDVYLGETPSESVRIMFHEKVTSEVSLIDYLQNVAGNELNVLIGPEGGFSDAEVERAVATGWELLSLGHRRLRAETAAIGVAATVSQLFLNH